jgi:hypothetical protein
MSIEKVEALPVINHCISSLTKAAPLSRFRFLCAMFSIGFFVAVSVTLCTTSATLLAERDLGARLPKPVVEPAVEDRCGNVLDYFGGSNGVWCNGLADSKVPWIL